MANYTIAAGDIEPPAKSEQSMTIGTAGEALTAGRAAWKDSANAGKWYHLDANGASMPTRANEIGFVMNSVSADQILALCVLDGTEITVGTSVGAEGDLAIADGTTAGELKPSADLASGEEVFQIGYFKDTDTLVIKRTVTGAVKA